MDVGAQLVGLPLMAALARTASSASSTLTYAQIEGLWIANGGSRTLAPIMAAIAKAESGGRTTALNDDAATGDYSVGLWQINYFGDMLSGRTKEYGSPAALMADPNLQAKAAISLAGNGSGLSNWTTYSSGAYKQYLSGAAPTTTGLPSGSGGSTGTTATDASDSSSTCLISIPITGGCLLTVSEGQALKGGLLIAAGGVVGIAGVGLLAAFGLKSTGALNAAAKTAVAVGAPEAAASLRAAHGRLEGRESPKQKAAMKPAKPAPAPRAPVAPKAPRATGQKSGSPAAKKASAKKAAPGPTYSKKSAKPSP